MEVRGQQPGGADDARARFRRMQAEVAQENRARVQRARELLQGLSARRHEDRKEERRVDQAELARESAEAVAQAARDQRAHVERSAADTTERVDRIEISSEGLAAHRTDPSDEARAARVEELKTAFDAGRLDTPERVERAATRMLGGAEATAGDDD